MASLRTKHFKAPLLVGGGDITTTELLQMPDIWETIAQHLDRIALHIVSHVSPVIRGHSGAHNVIFSWREVRTTVIMEWIHLRLRAHCDLVAHDSNVCAAVAQFGTLDMLKWAREHGYRWDARVCASAARGGHIDTLQWARAHGCPWNEHACARAARNGHIGVLKVGAFSRMSMVRAYVCKRGARWTSRGAAVGARSRMSIERAYVCKRGARISPVQCSECGRLNNRSCDVCVFDEPTGTSYEQDMLSMLWRV